MDYGLVRRASRALFGHRYRLELLAELADAGEQGICVTDMAKVHDAKASVFYPPLRELEKLGLVSRKGDRTGGRRVYYVPTQHEMWALITPLVRSALALTDGRPHDLVPQRSNTT